MIIGVKRARRLISALLLIAGSAQASALQDLDRRLERQKEAVLQLGVEAVESNEEALSAMGSRVSMYLETGRSGIILLSISVAIDDQAPTSHQFDADEMRGLGADSAYRLLELPLAPGVHRLHASVGVRDPGQGPDALPAALTVDGQVEVTDADLTLVLRPQADTWFSGAGLSLLERHPVNDEDPRSSGVLGLLGSLGRGRNGAAEYRLGDVDDPLIRYAQFLMQTRDYLRAAALLMPMQDQAPGHPLSSNYYRVLCGVLTKYGALTRARATCDEAVHVGLDAGVAADLRQQIAESYYQKGLLDEADRSLGLAPTVRDKNGLIAWKDLKTRILIAQDRIQQAGDELRETQNIADFGSYVRYYNLGVSLITEGEVGQGATILDRIGMTVGLTPDMLALADRANLVLGSHFLRVGQGATAIPILERVRLRGPYSNRALLALGWAWLAPAGNPQARVQVGDERVVGAPPETLGGRLAKDDQNLYQRYRLHSFDQVNPDGDQAARAKRALASWSELIDRDPEDESVQEGYLAIAYALAQLGAGREAAQYCERAASSLKAKIASLSESGKYVAGPAWVDELLDGKQGVTRFERELAVLPKVGVSSQLSDLIAGQAFQDGLADYRDLGAMASMLDQWDQEANAPRHSGGGDDLHERVVALRREVDTSRDQVIDTLRAILNSELQTQEQWQAHLLGTAELQLARLYDGFAPDGRRVTPEAAN